MTMTIIFLLVTANFFCSTLCRMRVENERQIKQEEKRVNFNRDLKSVSRPTNKQDESLQLNWREKEAKDSGQYSSSSLSCDVHLVRGLTGQSDPIELPCQVDQQQCGEVYYITWTKQQPLVSPTTSQLQHPSNHNDLSALAATSPTSAGLPGNGNVNSNQLPWTRVYLYTGANDPSPHKPIGDLINRATFTMPDSSASPRSSGGIEQPPAGGHLSAAKLIIEEPRLSDDALYKCDVTYVRGKCPSISLVRVQMLSLPEKAQLLVVPSALAPAAGSSPIPVSDGQQIGPYNENEQLRLSCLVFGGRPAPKSIIWRKIDASGRTINLLNAPSNYQHQNQNQLLLKSNDHTLQPIEVPLNHSLTSADLGAKFECHIEHEALEMHQPAARILNETPIHLKPGGRRQDSAESSEELTSGESATSGEESRSSRKSSLDSHVFIDLNVGVGSLDLFVSRVNKLAHQLATNQQQQVAAGDSMASSPLASGQVFKEGELVELECIAYNSRPPANISWFNGNEPIGQLSDSPASSLPISSSQVNGSRLRHKRLLQRQQVHQNQDGQTFNTHAYLSIKLSRHEHKSQITCQAQNKPMLSPVSKTIELQVQHAPIVMMEPAAGVTMNEAGTSGQVSLAQLEPPVIRQEDVSIYCIYQANPSDFLPNSTRWFRDGQLLSVERQHSSTLASDLYPQTATTNKRQVGQNRLFESVTATGYPVLTIRQVNRRDAGLYECQLANLVGPSERLSSNDAFRLEVNFKPTVQLKLYKLLNSNEELSLPQEKSTNQKQAKRTGNDTTTTTTTRKIQQQLNFKHTKYNVNQQLVEIDLSQELILPGHSFVFACEVLEAQPQKILKFSWFKWTQDGKRQLVSESEEDQLELSALDSDFRSTQFACSAQNSLGPSELSQQIELQLSYTPGPSLVLPVRDPATRRQILATGRPPVAVAGSVELEDVGVAGGEQRQFRNRRNTLVEPASAELMLECITHDLGQPKANVWLWLKDGKSIDAPSSSSSSVSLSPMTMQTEISNNQNQRQQTSGSSNANPIEMLSGQRVGGTRRQVGETETRTPSGEINGSGANSGDDNNDSDRQFQRTGHQQQSPSQSTRLVASGRYLFVASIQLAHKGNYSCVALNRLGSGGGISSSSRHESGVASTTLQLQVALAPSFVQPLGPRTYWPEVEPVTAGGSKELSSSLDNSRLELTCQVQCEPLCQLDWLRNNERLEEHSVTSANLPMNQFVSYKIERSLQDELPERNQFKGIESKLVLQFLPIETREKLRERRHFLSSSNFTCQSGANSMGPAVKSTTKFIVQYPPERVQINTPLQPGDKSSSSGGSADAAVVVAEGSNGPKLSCEATGEPRVQFRWLLVDQMDPMAAVVQTETETGSATTNSNLNTNTNMKPPIELSHLASESVGVTQGSSVSFLDLSNQVIERRQAGYYVCEASNRLGLRRQAIYVDVLYKPSCATLHLHSLDVTVAPSPDALGNNTNNPDLPPKPFKATSQDEYSLAVRESSEDFIGLRKMLVVAPLARSAKLLAGGGGYASLSGDSFRDSIFASILEQQEKSGKSSAMDLLAVDDASNGLPSEEHANSMASSSPMGKQNGEGSWEKFNSLLLRFLNNYQRQVRSTEEHRQQQQILRHSSVGRANLQQQQRDKRQNRRQSVGDEHQVNRIDTITSTSLDEQLDAQQHPSVTKNLITFACLARDGNPMQNLTFEWSFNQARLPESHVFDSISSSKSRDTLDARPSLLYANENQTLVINLIRRLDTKTSLNPFQLSLLTLDVSTGDLMPTPYGRNRPFKTRSASHYRVTRQASGPSTLPRPIAAPMIRSGAMSSGSGSGNELPLPFGGQVNSIELSGDNWQEQLGQLLRCSISNQVGQSDSCPVQVNLQERARQRAAAATSGSGSGSSLIEFAKWRFTPSLAHKSLLIVSVLIGCSLILFVTFTLLLNPHLKSLHLPAGRELSRRLSIKSSRTGRHQTEAGSSVSGKVESGTQSTSSQKSSVLGLLGNGDSSLQDSSQASSSSTTNSNSDDDLVHHQMRHQVVAGGALDTIISSNQYQQRLGPFQRHDQARMSHQATSSTMMMAPPYDRPKDRFSYHEQCNNHERSVDNAESPSLRATITTGSRLLSNLRQLSKFKTNHQSNQRQQHHRVADFTGANDLSKSLHLKTVSSSETNTTGLSALDGYDLSGLVSPQLGATTQHTLQPLESPSSFGLSLSRQHQQQHRSSLRPSHPGFSRNSRPQSYHQQQPHYIYNDSQQVTYSNMIDQQQPQKPYDAMEEFMRQRGIDTSFNENQFIKGGQHYGNDNQNQYFDHHYPTYQRPPPPPPPASKPPLHPRQHSAATAAATSNATSLYRASNSKLSGQSRPQVAARSFKQHEHPFNLDSSQMSAATMDNRFSMPSYLATDGQQMTFTAGPQAPLPTVSGNHYLQSMGGNTIDSHLSRMAIERVAYQASGHLVEQQRQQLTYANGNFPLAGHYDDATTILNSHLQDLTASSASEHIYDLNAYATPEQTPARQIKLGNNQLNNQTHQATATTIASTESERPRVSKLIQSFDHQRNLEI